LLEDILWFAGPLDNAKRKEIADALSDRPDQVAICVEPGGALRVEGRGLHSQGTGRIHLLLAASAGRPLWHTELQPGERHDLTMLRRAAGERACGEFPPVVPQEPVVEGGSLVIVGGGSLPAEVVQAFFDLAGGKDAPIVVLPIAAGDTLSGDTSNDIRLWARAGAKNVKSLRARTLDEINSPEFASALSEARGVWFSGGRQWRFIDAYLGTPAHELLRGVLRRGGVIGGSSAGASIQGQYMPRGSPLGNTDMMAEGYERGLGFLPGVAIDQHFSARRRHADMTRLMRRYPQLLGIGIDEGTALVVQSGVSRVVGRGSVYFYDYRTGPPAGPQDYTALDSGQSYDLVKRQALP
jgi:cyanophycinase